MKKGMNRKGLSDVVTTVLIILFAIVAVAVVGGIVLNQINKAGTSINKASICTDNQFKIDSCVTTASGTPSVPNSQAVIAFTRTTGDNIAKDLNYIIYAVDGSVVPYKESSANVVSGLDSNSIPALVTKGKSFANADFIYLSFTSAKSLDSVEMAVEYYVAGTTGDTQVCSVPKVKCIGQ